MTDRLAAPHAMVASMEKAALVFAHAVSGKIGWADEALAMVALLGIALTVVLVACPRCLAKQRPLHLSIARLREAAAALVLAAKVREGCLGHAFATAPLAHTRPAAHMLTQPRKVETTRLRLCVHVSEVMAQSLF